MKIKVEKCGEKVEGTPDPHWEVGALYQYTSGTYYYCFKHSSITFVVALGGVTSVHNVEYIRTKENRKLTKGECITLTVE